MKPLCEPKETLLSIRYRPSGETLYENPPRFTWVPESEQDLTYCLRVSGDPSFPEGKTLELGGIPYNFTSLDRPLEPGKYYWSYTLDDGEHTYSQTREFTISSEAVKDPVPAREDRFSALSHDHPRLWLNRTQIQEFRQALKTDPDHCGFRSFYENSVQACASQPFPGEPRRYPGDKRVVDLWRGNYKTCQRALEYIRSLCVGGALLEDEKYLALAKSALLEIIRWDVEGSTSRNYNDECSFRVAYAIAFGYDWLYDRLSEEERDQVRRVLYLRTKQVADHVMLDSRIHYSLYDSHAVRSLSSVLTPCCIAMLFECEDAARWLNYTLDYLNVIYTPWGGNDGGWAEGPMYWGSAMAFLIDALNLIKGYMGIDLSKRPFLQKTGDFQMYCNPTGTYRASFCDQSNLGRMAGHKQAFNIRQFAAWTGNPNYYKYYQEVFRHMPEIEDAFYNNGWWDFQFDEMVYRHQALSLQYGQPPALKKVKWFQDVGWVAVNQNMFDDDDHIFLLTKSSPYGSVSHSHGDQNAFVLFAYGEPLVIKSGHYIGFNTSMHRQWRRQTRSHNALLINGQGQYAEMDKAKQFAAKGQVLEVTENEQYVYIKEDATQAYLEHVPDLKQCQREIYFVQDSYVVLVDTVETEKDSDVEFCLHSLKRYQIQGSSFTVVRPRASLKGTVLYSLSGLEEITQSDQFEGVDPAELEGLDSQWHLRMKTGRGRSHRIVTLLVPEKAEEPKLVAPMKDDQGMDITFYLNYDGKVFTLHLPQSHR